MDATILLILVQDGVVNGAIYALLALSLVLVFAVTRVIFIPQGEFVAYGALTYAALDTGQLPGSVWLLCGLGLAACVCGLWQQRRTLTAGATTRLVLQTVVLPAAITALAAFVAPRKPGVLIEALLALAIVTPMAPYLYRVAFQALAEASVLVLLIAAVGVHLAMVGLGLVFFGPEGSRATGFSDAVLSFGALTVQGQALWIVGLTVVLMGALYGFFEFTLFGKALRATAVNRLGARLVGIATAQSGVIAFTLAGAIGALSGVLIAPLTTVYYDTGFLVGLKGFTAAIIGGLASYPAAALAAILVGIVESFSSFWASAFKEVIVFTVIIPVLLWRSLRSTAVEEDE
ncbi:branched-chain amino acid ABC transporter permease [Limobrevibacterium gyesilva]|uniref:Branched-chain amino acid ABC transporter permease n=1 Tax=Limobrevibacterium gyesilva TaxID=2991712 RepID=A0AA42CF83_9PROT|nr:branched-chain amino acid ABC transporter permease [Limobrevibacterium gyesilva]MCW3474496.1 branched-chain amino acid ABC transporter permease [Limobrevibacterium gyesilva]